MNQPDEWDLPRRPQVAEHLNRPAPLPWFTTTPEIEQAWPILGSPHVQQFMEGRHGC